MASYRYLLSCNIVRLIFTTTGVLIFTIQCDNIALKDDLTPLFQQQTITIFLGTNPAQVGWRSITKDILKSIAKDIQSLSSQSECAFNDIHCFSIHLCHLKHAYLSVEDTKWLMVGGVLNIRSTDLHPSSGSAFVFFDLK